MVANSSTPPIPPSTARAAASRTGGSSATCHSTASATAQARGSESVTSVAAESAPCSASLTRSMARRSGSAESSAMSRLSDGPHSIWVAVP